jgi:hypothetical protein
VFVGSGIFKSEDPERTARAIVEATTHYDDPERIAAAAADARMPRERPRLYGDGAASGRIAEVLATIPAG